MNHTTEYKEAQMYVNKLSEFYQHLAAYVLVNTGLFIFNIVTDQTWFLYPLLGWGIGITAHAANVFVISKAGKGWREKKIEEYMKKENR